MIASVKLAIDRKKICSSVNLCFFVNFVSFLKTFWLSPLQEHEMHRPGSQQLLPSTIWPCWRKHCKITYAHTKTIPPPVKTRALRPSPEKHKLRLTAVAEEGDVDVVSNGNQPQRVADETRDVRIMVDKYCTTSCDTHHTRERQRSCQDNVRLQRYDVTLLTAVWRGTLIVQAFSVSLWSRANSGCVAVFGHVTRSYGRPRSTAAQHDQFTISAVYSWLTHTHHSTQNGSV